MALRPVEKFSKMRISAMMVWTMGLVKTQDPEPRESMGRLSLGEAVPASKAALCRDECHISERFCSAQNADTWLDTVAPVHGHLAAWAATVWDPRELLPRILERWGAADFRSPTVVHGSLWRTMWDFVEPTKFFDPNDLYTFIFDDVLKGFNLTEPPRYLQTVIHGFGHGALFAAHKASSSWSNTSLLSCQQGPFTTSKDIAHIAESICAEMPRPLAYLCAGGIFHSIKFPPVEGLTNFTSIHQYGGSPIFDLCETMDYKAFCIYQRWVLALDDADVQNRVVALASSKSTNNATDDVPPGPGIIESFCPHQRWGQDLAQCYYGVAGGLAKSRLWTKRGFCEVPLHFEICRPSSPVYDDATALLVQSCVQGLLYRSLVVSSDKFYLCHQDDLATACQNACEILRHDHDPNMRSAYDSCRSNYVCLHSGNNTAPTDSFINVPLLESGRVPTFSSLTSSWD